MQIYYAHSIALYGTIQERRDVADLEALGFKVVNPNLPEHAAGYEAEGMAYFVKLLNGMYALAFRANPDGSVNAGVAKEIEAVRANGGVIIELPSGIDRRTLTVEQTRSYLKEQGVR